MQGTTGIVFLLILVWLLSEDRALAGVRFLIWGLAAQAAMALFLLRLPVARDLFLVLGQGVDAISAATRAGTAFVFGYVGGGPAPFDTTHPEHGFVLAFQALPVVIVITALSAILYHLNVLPWLVRHLSRPLQKAFGLGGAVGMSAAAMTFLGMVESPLLIRPYLAQLTRSELFILMTGGMSTIAGSVMILYATFLTGIIPDPIGHLLTSALMGIPLAIGIAKTLCPQSQHGGADLQQLPDRYGGTMDALMQGTMDGVRIVVGIVAVLLVMVALVHLANQALMALPGGMTLPQLVGLFLRPLAWSLGVPTDQVAIAGTLLGEKLVLNELIAFSDLARLPADALDAKARIILVYALCSFSNFGSLAILVGGLSAMAPERRADIIALGPKALLAGTITSCLNGAVAGLLA